MNTRAMKWIWVAGIGLLFGFSGIVHAGKIISVPSASGAEGFGGWNMENVEVKTYKDLDGTIPTDTEFDETDGAYDPETVHFESMIQVSAATATPMAILKGKDYPVGEPPGIKIINDDDKVKEGKPVNCIMTTSYLEEGYLDSGTPIQTTCSSSFQTHKRFKVNMQPGSLNTNGGAIDLVFNVEDESGSLRDYQIFQKINNYTGKRLEGFSVQVGTGTGPLTGMVPESGFVPAGSVSGVGLDKLSLWASTDPANGIWNDEDLANFAFGLFGDADTNKNFDEDGFFDISQRAGFFVDAAEFAGDSDRMVSTGTQGSNYAQVPPGLGPDEQFGPWQYSGIEPYGVFYDDDGDPSTDAVLMAFWGDEDGLGINYSWMYGDSDDLTKAFAVVEGAELNVWASDPLYYIARIEDMLNLGLNYVVNVGAVDATWPTWDATTDPLNPRATFTIRIIPEEDVTSGIGEPGYIGNPPPPLEVTANEGTVSISPKPYFEIGDTLAFYVADGNTTATSTELTLVNLSTGEIESSVQSGGVIAMTEVEGKSGLYYGELPTSALIADNADNDGTMYVEPGDIIEITYYDIDLIGTEPTDQTQAAIETTFFVVPLPNGGAAVFDL